MAEGNKNTNYKSQYKINVFVSSLCNSRYTPIRRQIKEAIEKSINANVYVFEDDTASSMELDDSYLSILHDCHVCIFLIDNKDGISEAVKKEIEYVNNNNIKPLYIFSSGRSSKKTWLQEKLENDKNNHSPKYMTVRKFGDLSDAGIQSLLDDIKRVYLKYCHGLLDSQVNKDSTLLNNINISKGLLKNIDKSTNYLHKYIFNSNFDDILDNQKNASKIDSFCCEFLDILLGESSIDKFNYENFIDSINNLQDNNLIDVVTIRWNSIMKYYHGNIVESVKSLNEAYELAKNNNVEEWLIQDILIDMRNQEILQGLLENKYLLEPESQKKLNSSNSSIYYPTLDRINSELQGYFSRQLYKEKLSSPFTVTVGVNYFQQCRLLVSYLLTAMYFGSLTHILLFYEKLRDFLFYLSCNEGSLCVSKKLYKLTIFIRNQDDLKGLENTFSNLLDKFNNEDFINLLKFCKNQPVHYYRRISEYLAFGSTGYYLTDNEFNKYKSIIFGYIYTWLDDDACIVNEGKYIINCLKKVGYRIDQFTLIDFCCRFIDKKYTKWFDDLFDFMDNFIDLTMADSDDVNKLLYKIEELLLNEDTKEIVGHNNSFLSKFRRQKRTITNHLDKVISQALPEYYDGTYKFETTNNKQEVYSDWVNKYIKIMKSNNQEQGKNGVYHGYGINYYETIRRILLDINYKCELKMQDKIIECVCETLKNTRENVSVRLNGISLLLTILLKYNNSYDRNKKLLDDLINNEDLINKNDSSVIFTNINVRALTIGFLLLEDLLELGVFEKFVESMTYVNNESATILAVQNLFINYLSSKEGLTLRDNMNSSILLYTLQWLKEDNLTIKKRALRLLMLLACNPKNVNIVNFEILNIIDNSNGYIKSYILQNMKQIDNLPKKTLNYIYTKCEKDQCYMVREICHRVKNNISLWS